MAEATDFIIEGGHWFVKLSYEVRLKSCSREIWLSLIDEGFESELKIDNYIDYYMEFFRQKINHDGHDFNKLKEDTRKYIKNKYEKNKIAQCSVCGEVGSSNSFWGRTQHNWKHKICLSCSTEQVKCSCCGDVRQRRNFPFIEEEERYSDICLKCTNIAKNIANTDMTALELEDYTYNIYLEHNSLSGYAYNLYYDKKEKTFIKKDNSKQINIDKYDKETIEKKKIGQCSICGETGKGNKFWGRTEHNWKHKICKSCNNEPVQCDCCGSLRVRKYYDFNEDTGLHSTICKYCSKK